MARVSPLLLLTVFVLSLLSPARTQVVERHGSAGFGVTSSGPSPVGIGKSLAAKPYSAEETTEHAQILADGTHISEAGQHTMMYRDSAGRTRMEVKRSTDGSTTTWGLINIFDPVAGYTYSLDPENHVAHRRAWAKLDLPSGTKDRLPSLKRLDPKERARTPQITSEPLGMQTMEGITVQGSRTTIVYPEGAFGNDRPITVVSDSWRSPELDIVVFSKTSDPRSGEAITRLTNVSREEPDPSLFRIPADYSIVEDPPPIVQFKAATSN